MSQELPNKLTDPSSDIITLHPLCEEDFPWLLMWMKKEDKASMSLLLQTTRNTKEIAIITATLNNRERVGLLTFYAAAFTRLRSPYFLQHSEYSLQHVEINPMVYKQPATLPALLSSGASWMLSRQNASRILWEINSKDTLWREMAYDAGFLSITGKSDPEPAFTLYEYSMR